MTLLALPVVLAWTLAKELEESMASEFGGTVISSLLLNPSDVTTVIVS
ncbi:hypothetical protein J4P90_12545 [Bacillus sp. SY8(2021)]|uniref:Uncharacterized protein n=1 Tax=Bacillus arachidis TaxID=2819290 RepID=A0ABS3NYQ2_9BACI|nr:hypothetical protein [Bacillus arachidis]